MLSRRSPLPTAVDLFSGSGAVTEGLVQGGFRVVAAIDNDAVACATYRLNHPRVRLYEQDIERVSPRQIRRIDLCGRDVDLLVVCAPCQPFSSQTRATIVDSRVRLLLQSISFASVLRPKLIFFENVPGLAARRHVTLISKLRQGLARQGYELGDPLKIDAADYGVPQRRLRCIMLASRVHFPARDFLERLVPAARTTVRSAIGGLQRLKSGESDPNDVLHRARAHQPIALKRLANIPKDGGSRSALPKRLELECHRGRSGHPDVYGRMTWDDVAPTLTTGCTDVTRGRFAHPEDDRAITLREAALLQTFPLSYQFTGNYSEIAIQIGNAVPVRLISALAPAFKSMIGACGRRKYTSAATGRLPLHQ